MSPSAAIAAKSARERGFTLVEVMVALFIAALMTVTVSQVAGQRIDLHLALQQKQFAALCARELAARFRVEGYWPAPGQQQGQFDQAGSVCYWRAEVSTTAVPALRRAEVSLYDSQPLQQALDLYTLYLEQP